MDSFNDNDVVITGVSGVFPKADNLEEFSEKLFAKENLLSSETYNFFLKINWNTLIIV